MKSFFRAAFSLAILGALAVLETRRPLRKPVESKLRRTSRNLLVAGFAAAAIQLAEVPVVRPLCELVERKRWGLLPRLRLPRWAESVAAILLMDYTLYLWHVLTHRVPILWRFHAVHHVDRDLDASTALRFHFGEMALSVPWRAAQVVLIGVGPKDFQRWQRMLSASILFHHSNVRLPSRVETVLSYGLVTPRMHGIHHGTLTEETNSNWSSGLSLWDRLHRTFRMDIPQEQIRIGLRGFEREDQVRLRRLLALPFEQTPELRAALESYSDVARNVAD
jgi:sterol desaturase/sphingolipid hydroxylase (fatty acid hydroxylase superfamily)